MKMNKKKILSLIIAALFPFIGTFAAGNERGIDLYLSGFYDAAKFFFLDQKGQTGKDLAENYYFLGQTYYELQKADSAAYYYAKATEVAPEYAFGYIGEGKVALKNGDTKLAESLFKKATDQDKKNASVQTSIAESYLLFKMLPQAKDAIAKANKINKNYPDALILEGDVAMSENELGKASGFYDRALMADPNAKVAYLKAAKIYEYINPKASLEYLDKLIAIDPEYIPAYALIGDINRNQGMYAQALRAYEKIISIPGLPILQQERYAQLLYFTDQYDKSLEQINYVLTKDPNNVVMYRLRAYNSLKLENYELGTKQMEEFFNKAPQDQYIYQDYTTYGRLLIGDKKPEEAIVAFQKALALDSTKLDIYKELILAYERSKKYPEAIAEYEKLFEKEESPSLADYFNYGRAIYSAAVKYVSPEYLNASVSPEQKALNDAEFNTYLDKGNMAFNKVIESRPDFYQAFLYQARLNSLLDFIAQTGETSEMQGAAIPYYEKSLELMLASNENGSKNKEILEAYRYFGSYYYVHKEYPRALEYFKKILELQPDNTDVKQTIESIERM